MLAEALSVTLRVGEVLEQLGVEWVVGGSLASSLQGIPRATQDVDLVANLRLDRMAGLVQALEENFSQRRRLMARYAAMEVST